MSDELQNMYDRGWKSFHEWAADSSNKIMSDEGVGREYGDKLREMAADKVGTAAMKGAYAQGWRANKPYRDSLESQVEELTRDLAAAREELAAITEHVITSIYGFAPVDSGSQLSGAVKSICDERDELRAQLAAANATVAQCKAAGFIDEQGNVRKVLGVLPQTKDGCFMGDSSTPWVLLLDGTVERGTTRTTTFAWTTTTPGRKENKAYAADMCYSTRTAAEAAREGKETT